MGFESRFCLLSPVYLDFAFAPLIEDCERLMRLLKRGSFCGVGPRDPR
jgi:hypothetical protein